MVRPLTCHPLHSGHCLVVLTPPSLHSSTYLTFMEGLVCAREDPRQLAFTDTSHSENHTLSHTHTESSALTHTQCAYALVPFSLLLGHTHMAHTGTGTAKEGSSTGAEIQPIPPLDFIWRCSSFCPFSSAPPSPFISSQGAYGQTPENHKSSGLVCAEGSQGLQVPLPPDS